MKPVPIHFVPRRISWDKGRGESCNLLRARQGVEILKMACGFTSGLRNEGFLNAFLPHRLELDLELNTEKALKPVRYGVSVSDLGL